ncbi:FIG01045727: hypothetical protein [Salmonella enterica subsp. enterica serovar Rissen]|nr:FIG01045727: hypothetical protein [Salmonella enterica subsp. enterica serovar Rissen]
MALARQFHGLSPLARGTLRDIYVPDQAPRFIPAGAGNTTAARGCSRGLPVYPRWRGEHHIGGADRSAGAGLSPLARGTPRQMKWDLTQKRFIPAGAGNTAHGVCPRRL